MNRYILFSIISSFICITQNSCVQKGHSEDNVLKGKWETILSATHPIARHECSFVTVDSKFYLLGGRGIKPVSICNTETNTWRVGTSSTFTGSTILSTGRKNLDFL